MKSGARLDTAIKLLDMMDDGDSRPADKLLSDWARANRFAGSKDRQAIAGMVYGVLRRHSQIDWWLVRCDINVFANRQRVLIWLSLWDGKNLKKLTEWFDGGKYAPKELSAGETRMLVELENKQPDSDNQPIDVKGNFPKWMEKRFVRLYGDDTVRQLSIMSNEATVDIRVNTLKGTREEAKDALAREKIYVAETKFSPNGLRLNLRKPLSGCEAFKSGLIEIQDEGSQILSSLVDAKPGAKVVDFCAGAGGKTLALAADMNNSGRIVACDISEGRLKRAAVRLKRAGVHMVERRPLTSERDKWIKRRAGRFGGGFDRVLVDAPCSGTGTWRRNPDSKWRLTSKDLDELAKLQFSILDSASRLVMAGGRLIYATCSLLPEENEVIVDRFLNENKNFFIHPLKDIWQDVMDCPCPVDGDMLRLTPADHGTDGFFAAILERKLT